MLTDYISFIAILTYNFAQVSNESIQRLICSGERKGNNVLTDYTSFIVILTHHNFDVVV